MANWTMLTLVGTDQPGIVAKLTQALYQAGCNLGEASMMRLGGNFTIMLMVSLEGDSDKLRDVIQPISDSLNLHYHIDAIEAQLHQHLEPDVRISVYGADRPGIVSDVTASLADAGLHILDLESDVAGSEAEPIYIMHIEGHAGKGVDALKTAVEKIKSQGIDVSLSEIDTLLG